MGKYIAAFSFVAPLIGFVLYHVKENNLVLKYDPNAKSLMAGLATYIAPGRLYQNPEFMREYNRLSYIKWGCFFAWVVVMFIASRYIYYFG